MTAHSGGTRTTVLPNPYDVAPGPRGLLRHAGRAGFVLLGSVAAAFVAATGAHAEESGGLGGVQVGDAPTSPGEAVDQLAQMSGLSSVSSLPSETTSSTGSGDDTSTTPAETTSSPSSDEVSSATNQGTQLVGLSSLSSLSGRSADSSSGSGSDSGSTTSESTTNSSTVGDRSVGSNTLGGAGTLLLASGGGSTGSGTGGDAGATTGESRSTFSTPLAPEILSPTQKSFLPSPDLGAFGLNATGGGSTGSGTGSDAGATTGESRSAFSAPLAPETLSPTQKSFPPSPDLGAFGLDATSAAGRPGTVVSSPQSPVLQGSTPTTLAPGGTAAPGPDLREVFGLGTSTTSPALTSTFQPATGSSDSTADTSSALAAALQPKVPPAFGGGTSTDSSAFTGNGSQPALGAVDLGREVKDQLGLRPSLNWGDLVPQANARDWINHGSGCVAWCGFIIPNMQQNKIENSGLPRPGYWSALRETAPVSVVGGLFQVGVTGLTNNRYFDPTKPNAAEKDLAVQTALATGANVGFNELVKDYVPKINARLGTNWALQPFSTTAVVGGPVFYNLGQYGLRKFGEATGTTDNPAVQITGQTLVGAGGAYLTSVLTDPRNIRDWKSPLFAGGQLLLGEAARWMGPGSSADVLNKSCADEPWKPWSCYTLAKVGGGGLGPQGVSPGGGASQLPGGPFGIVGQPWSPQSTPADGTGSVATQGAESGGLMMPDGRMWQPGDVVGPGTFLSPVGTNEPEARGAGEVSTASPVLQAVGQQAPAPNLLQQGVQAAKNLYQQADGWWRDQPTFTESMPAQEGAPPTKRVHFAGGATAIYDLDGNKVGGDATTPAWVAPWQTPLPEDGIKAGIMVGSGLLTGGVGGGLVPAVP